AFAGPQTDAEMVASISALATAGARVIVDDTSFFSEPKFQDGPIAQTVRAFAQNGNVYVSAAGNEALAHYRPPYNRLTGKQYPSDSSPAVHNYLPSAIDIGNTLSLPPGCTLTAVLQWNNPVGAAADDFDLIIGRSSDLAPLAVSAEDQSGAGDALEI